MILDVIGELVGVMAEASAGTKVTYAGLWLPYENAGSRAGTRRSTGGTVCGRQALPGD